MAHQAMLSSTRQGTAGWSTVVPLAAARTDMVTRTLNAECEGDQTLSYNEDISRSPYGIALIGGSALPAGGGNGTVFPTVPRVA